MKPNETTVKQMSADGDICTSCISWQYMHIMNIWQGYIFICTSCISCLIDSFSRPNGVSASLSTMCDADTDAKYKYKYKLCKIEILVMLYLISLSTMCDADTDAKYKYKYKLCEREILVILYLISLCPPCVMLIQVPAAKNVKAIHFKCFEKPTNLTQPFINTIAPNPTKRVN